MFLDSHCHLVDRKFDADRTEVIHRALDGGLRYMLTVACNLSEAYRSLELADFYEHIYAAAAVHPHDADDFKESETDAWLEIYSHPKLLAVGEIGLDYWYDFSPRDRQQKVFRHFLRIAMKLDMPVIIHLRDPKEGPKDATADFLRILDEEDPGRTLRGIMHCFPGDYEFGMTCYERGFLISFPGILTFSKSEMMQDAAARLPYESLLVETDCPFLAPIPHRGKRNEPVYVIETAKKLASLRGVTEEDIDRIVLNNFERLFSLDKPLDKDIVAYRIRNSMYLNLTNRCTSNCTFCERTKSAMVSGYNLRLRKEPTVAEALAAVGDATRYDEVVFCGYGEPLIRLEEIKQIATELKKQGVRIRLNTAGHGELIHGRDVLPELKGLIDEISLSINAADASTYVRLMRPYKGKKAFDAMQRFARRAVELGFDVTATAVEVPGLEMSPIEKLAESLGAKWRSRMYNVVG